MSVVPARGKESIGTSQRPPAAANNGQGSLEYLLLISGAILVTIMVFIILISLPLESVLGDNVITYQSQVNLDALYAPNNVWLTATPGNGVIALGYSATDVSSIAYTLIRAQNQSSIQSVPVGLFEAASGSHGITLIADNVDQTAFNDFSILVGPDYFYRVQACDHAVPRNCTASGVASTALHGVNPTIVLGEPEIVFSDWCGPLDVPDSQAHAIRNPTNQSEIVFFTGNAPAYYISTGTNFDNLTRQCGTPALLSDDLPGASTFNNYEWLTTPFSDGTTVHGFIHNEYHDPSGISPCTTLTDASNPCWYNSIEYASSPDGKFFDSTNNPLVAAPPLMWTPGTNPGQMGTTPYGYFTPSNIVSRDEGGGVTAYYLIVHAITTPGNQATGGICPIRTTDLSDPASWRGWDGSGYTLEMKSPYLAGGQSPCTTVSFSEIGSLGGSLTYHPASNQYLLVGIGIYKHQNLRTCGAWYSTSMDLINWSPPKLITDGQFFGACAGSTNTIYYASLIDHTASDPNFMTVGSDAYLYYQTISPANGLDRQLMRRAIHFNGPI